MFTRILLTLALVFLITACNQLPFNPIQGGGGNVKSPVQRIGDYELITGSGETNVYDVSGRTKIWLATYTTGTRTVTMSGDERTFEEDNIEVTHDTWVRLLPAPHNGNVDLQWMEDRLAENVNGANVPDILAIAAEYLDGGINDAKYGPDNTLDENSDWIEFLGIDHTYIDHWSESLQKYVDFTDTSSAERLGAVDCSGFMRLVYGYRGGIPMMYNPDPQAPNSLFPRRSFQIWENCIGKVVMDGYTFGMNNADEKLDQINIGDLVVFDADSSSQVEIGRVDHIGMYIGVDDDQNMRFLHSRRSGNRGPTFSGDQNGKSIINNDGTNNYLYYAKAFKGARRL